MPAPLLDQLTRWLLDDLETRDTADSPPITASDLVCGLLHRLVETDEEQLPASWLVQLGVIARPNTAALIGAVRRHADGRTAHIVSEIPGLVSVPPPT